MQELSKSSKIFQNILFLLAICLIILNTVLLIRVQNKVEKISKKITNSMQDLNKSFTTIIEINELSNVREQLIEQLKVYSPYDENGPIDLYRHGKNYDGGYVVATKALKDADVLLGYGIDKDNSFEDQFSIKYNKPSFGFDCGIESIKSQSNLFTLIRECIATHEFLYDVSSSNKNITTFNHQLEKLDLKDKKLFIKMDIEGAEYDALEEVMKHTENITGIVLEIHFGDLKTTTKALNLLKKINREFLLIHLHGNNHSIQGFTTSKSTGLIPNVLELSYINKKLVQGFSVAPDQSHPLKIDQPNSPDLPDASFTIKN